MTDERDIAAQEAGLEQFDRGNVSVARDRKSKKLLLPAALFMIGAVLVIVLVAINGSGETKKSAAQEEETFRVGNSSSKPYIASPPKPTRSQDVSAPISAMSDDNRLAELEERRRLAMEAQARQESEKQMLARLKSPQLIIDGSTDNVVATSGASGSLTGGDNDANASFARSAGSDTVKRVEATRIESIETLIPQGTMIQGVLETAISSNLPGYTRAVVSEDVYSFDGSTLLVPQGTALIGRYRSAIVQGQSRVFIIWQRLLRHDGVSVMLDSYGADPLGRSGVAGEVDTHFFERFGGAIMLSMIDAAIQAGVNATDDENTSTVALDAGQDFSRAAEIALENSINIPPTIYINQGERISIFVGHDLDFSSLVEEATHAVY